MKEWVVSLALLLSACYVLPKDQGKNTENKKKEAVDSGSFSVYLDNKRIATEKFTIEQQAGEGILTAAISLDDGTTRAEQTSEMRVGADGNLRLYHWRYTLPTQEESTVEPKDELLLEHVTTGDGKKRDVPYILPLSTVILDDNFFSHRELLIWRYLAVGCIRKDAQLHCGPSHFGTLVPHQHSASAATVELLGPDTITVKGAQRQLNKVKVDADGVQWLIWLDDPENRYKVIKMAIPSSNIEVLRD